MSDFQSPFGNTVPVYYQCFFKKHMEVAKTHGQKVHEDHWVECYVDTLDHDLARQGVCICLRTFIDGEQMWWTNTPRDIPTILRETGVWRQNLLSIFHYQVSRVYYSVPHKHFSTLGHLVSTGIHSHTHNGTQDPPNDLWYFDAVCPSRLHSCFAMTGVLLGQDYRPHDRSFARNGKGRSPIPFAPFAHESPSEESDPELSDDQSDTSQEESKCLLPYDPCLYDRIRTVLLSENQLMPHFWCYHIHLANYTHCPTHSIHSCLLESLDWFVSTKHVLLFRVLEHMQIPRFDSLLLKQEMYERLVTEDNVTFCHYGPETFDTLIELVYFSVRDNCFFIDTYSP